MGTSEMKVVIIGGSAGGASVAARLRRIDEFCEIIMFEKSADISFATCGMPYYIGGVIKDRERMTVVNPEEFKGILNVDVRLNSEITDIDRNRKMVKVKSHVDGKEYEESYDKLVLSPGGKPVIPKIPGIKHGNIFSLRGSEDMEAIKSHIGNKLCKRALIVGAGFIGLELAENLAHVGLKVTIVDIASQVMNSWDYDMATILHHHLKSKKVNLVLENLVTSFSDKGATLENGKTIASDITILCIGVAPDIELAKRAKLDIHDTRSIQVNDGMVTNDCNIYALGDVVAVRDMITHKQALIPLAGIAQKQARIVAENIVGRHRVVKDFQSTAIAKVFDLTVALTGKSEKELIEQNIGFRKTYVEAASHAGYYPDAHPMILKLLYSRNRGNVLGAQIIGVAGVDKRIDVLATAIEFEKNVEDLVDLELAYAPPFSSAKDPVNIIGMVAKNTLYEGYETIEWDEIDKLDLKTSMILDVRTDEEFEIQSIEGAVHIPLTKLRERLSEIPKNKVIVIYCQTGKKSYFAFCILKQHGYEKVYNLNGGYKIYNLIKMDQGQHGIFDYDQISIDGDIHIDIVEGSEEMKPERATEHDHNIEVDACGVSCPGPILMLSKNMKKAQPGDIMKITATDMGFVNDMESWCRKTGNTVLETYQKDAKFTAVIRKE